MATRDPADGPVAGPINGARGRAPVVVGVLLLHVLLLVVLQHAGHRTDRPREQHASSIRMITIQLPPLASTPPQARSDTRAPAAQARPGPAPDRQAARSADRASRRATTEAPPTVDRAPDGPRTTVVLTRPTAPEASASAASGPSGRDLLYGAATQRAIRQSTQGQPLLAERADQASQAPDRADASTRLGQDMMKSATTDCLKGEYAGGGMGLLSAPFLLLAEARGKCRR